MHADIRLVLMLLAIVCFVLSACGISTVKWDRFVAAGLAFWALAVLLA